MKPTTEERLGQLIQEVRGGCSAVLAGDLEHIPALRLISRDMRDIPGPLLERKRLTLRIETTGLSLEHDRVCALIGYDWHAQKKFIQLINPKRKLDPGAAKRNKLTDVLLEDQPEFSHFAKGISRRINSYELVVTWRSPWEFNFINAELDRCGMDNLNVDTLGVQIFIPGSAALHRVQTRTSTAIDKCVAIDREFVKLSEEMGLPGSFIAAQIVEMIEAAIDWSDRANYGGWLWSKPDTSGGFTLMFKRGKHSGLSLDDVALTDVGHLKWISRLDDAPEKLIETLRSACP